MWLWASLIWRPLESTFGGVSNLLDLTPAQKIAFYGSNKNQTWNVVAQNSFQLVFKRKRDDVGNAENVLDALKYPYAVEISKRQWESVYETNQFKYSDTSKDVLE